MIKTCLFLSLLLFEAIHSNFIVQKDKDAMAYLTKYGYTLQQCGNKKMACVMNQQNLKTIIKDFQRQFKLRVTGRLDFQTKQLMKRPRCAVPDRKSSLLVQWSNGDAIWNHQRLTWSFRDENTTYAHWIEEAFRKWKEIIPQFEFHQVCSTCQADINLSFQTTSHGHEGHNEHEGFHPETLAHAHYPKDGTIHFHSNMKWTHSFEQFNNMYNFYLVATHEIGHALGYVYKGDPHNIDDASSIMYPIYNDLEKDDLFTEADKQAMQNIYPNSNDEGETDGDENNGGEPGGGEIDWNGNNWAHACDFHGGNLDQVKTIAERCGPKCAQTRGCTHFTWSPDNDGTCWMKTGHISKSNAYYTGNQSMVCGVHDLSLRSTINWNGNWAHACDFSGKDLNQVKTIAERCGPKCAQTRGCTHFAWSPNNGGICWMKKGEVSKDDAYYTYDDSMVCGVVISS